MNKKRDFVELSRTNNEWASLEKRIKEKSPNATIQSYILNRISVLIKDYKECPECILELASQKRSHKKVYTNKEMKLVLEEISKKTNNPIATIVDRVIIQPMLIEK